MTSAEQMCGRLGLWARLTQWFVLVSVAVALPATTLDADATTSSPRVVECFPRERKCWSSGRLPFPGGRCEQPLSRGACGEGQWVVLDLDLLEPAASLRGRCARRPCPAGQLPSDGHCLPEGAARAALCGGRAAHLDPWGLPRCGDFPGWTTALTALALCSEAHRPPSTAVAVGAVYCAQRDGGDCAKEVRGPATSAVVIQSED